MNRVTGIIFKNIFASVKIRLRSCKVPPSNSVQLCWGTWVNRTSPAGHSKSHLSWWPIKKKKPLIITALSLHPYEGQSESISSRTRSSTSMLAWYNKTYEQTGSKMQPRSRCRQDITCSLLCPRGDMGLWRQMASWHGNCYVLVVIADEIMFTWRERQNASC